MNTIKHATIIAAALAGFAATQALADTVAPALPSQAVKLTEAQLDNITAGSATVLTAVLNPGNAFVFKADDLTNAHCVNCGDFGGNGRLILVVNPARTVSKCTGSLQGLC